MGRWTPLVLMAGGLAILLGTLLGINFPMGQRTAQNPQEGGNRTSSVLPANINVNSTVSGSKDGAAGSTRVAQSNATSQAGSTNNQETGSSSAQSSAGQTQAQADTTTVEPAQPATGNNEQPIRALW